MKMHFRILCFAVGLALFVWVSSKTRVFNPDRALVDPSVPVILLVFVGVFAAIAAWICAFVAIEVRNEEQRCAGGTGLPPAESPEPTETAAGPVTSGESSPPAG